MVWGLLRRSSAWGSRNGILGSGPTVRPSEIESEVPPGVMAAIVSTRGSDVRDSRDHGWVTLRWGDFHGDPCCAYGGGPE